MEELIRLAMSWQDLLAVLGVFGFAPGCVLRLLVMIYPRDNPRRKELVAQLYVLKRRERSLFVAEQLETVLFEGVPNRVRALRRRLARNQARPSDDSSRARQSIGQPGAAMGLDVVSALVRGIVDYRRENEQDNQVRSLGPALLGAFPWMDDDHLIRAIADTPSACVVVGDQSATTSEKLRQACGRANGFPAQACPGLRDLAPSQNGRPLVVGPTTQVPEIVLPTFRSIGRTRSDHHQAPTLHTKMVLLGHLWWHDEGPLGHVEDVIGFTPEKLWVGSANGIRNAQSYWECGEWITDPDRVAAAHQHLIDLIRHSESIAAPDEPHRPDIAPYEFDNAAMGEAVGLLHAEDNDNFSY